MLVEIYYFLSRRSDDCECVFIIYSFKYKWFFVGYIDIGKNKQLYRLGLLAEMRSSEGSFNRLYIYGDMKLIAKTHLYALISHRNNATLKSAQLLFFYADILFLCVVEKAIHIYIWIRWASHCVTNKQTIAQESSIKRAIRFYIICCVLKQ